MSAAFLFAIHSAAVWAVDFERRVAFTIAAQPLSSALVEFSQQARIQVMSRDESLAKRESAALRGSYSIREALGQLLEGTGLAFSSAGENTIAVLAKDASASEKTGARAVESEEAGNIVRLEEVIVTATKRMQRVQDVPISIAVIGDEDVERRGLIGMEDYLRSIPGVNQIDSGARSNAIVIRGITTSPTFENFSSAATVASYFDETPITGAAGIGAGGIDVRPVDIERIEILRGPQGTAFGSASLGGTLRMIPVKPDLAAFGGRIAASYSETRGDGAGNSMIQGIANVPIVSDTFALRAVGYRYSESGFYSNVAGVDAGKIAFAEVPGLGGNYVRGFVQDDVGRMVSTGGRLAAAWRVTDRLSVHANFLTQKIEQDGFPATTTGGYAQALLPIAPQGRVRGQAGDVSDTRMDLVNLVLDYKLTWATLTSAVSHVDSGSDLATDLWTFSTPASALVPSEFESFTLETRMASQLEGPFQFLAGLFYEDVAESNSTAVLWPGTPQTSPAGTNPMLYQEISRDLVQRAIFGEVSYEITQRLSATAGGRYFKYRKNERDLNEGGLFFVPIGSGVPTDLASSEGNSNFKASLRYQVRDGSQLYVSWSEGFRLGRPAVGLPATCDVNNDGIVDGTAIQIDSTRRVASDFLDNYEIGTKLALSGRRMVLDAAVYHIEWRGLPNSAFVDCSPQGYTANAGAAESDGMELQGSLLVGTGLKLDFGAAYTNAKLTEDAPALAAQAGDRLPGSARISLNLAAQYEFNLMSHRAFIRGDSFYVGKFYGDLAGTPSSAAGDYVHVDARAGVAFSDLDIALFVRNVTNEDAFTFRQALSGSSSYGHRLRPRTIGLQLGYHFD